MADSTTNSRQSPNVNNGNSVGQEKTQQNRAINARADSETIEKNFVSEKSIKTYTEKLITFGCWLFDKHKGFLTPEFIPKMTEEDKKDRDGHREKIEARVKKIQKNNRIREKEAKESQHKASKRSKKKLKDPPPVNFNRKCLRKLWKKLIGDVKPRNKATDDHRSPIIIEGEKMITYEIIKEFMSTKSNEVNAEKGSAETFLKSLGKNENNPVVIEDDQVDSVGCVKLQVHQSASQYSGIRSAVMFLFRSARIEPPNELRSQLSTYIAGLERTILKEKEKLGLSLLEGKKEMSEEAYELLAEALFCSSSKKDVFSHLFLVLDWNLMKRAENCVNAQINHIYFDQDSLVFEFAKSKGHQKGERHLGPWHCYANPEKPFICPVLAMARYLFCYPEVLRGNSPLFEGSSQYERYLSRFHLLLKEYKDELKELGYEEGDLGTHSVRKGVGSKIASGCTVSPPIVAICVRVGWALGGVKDKYLFRENAGDQYVGRCASGLSQLTKEFAISPPYFDYTSLSDVEKIHRKDELKQLMKERIPDYDKINGKTLHLTIMCFASLCYHEQFLLTHLHEKCPLRAAPMFRNIPDTILSLAKVEYPWSATADTPSFSGIPPHITLLSELEQVKIELKSLKTSLIDELKGAMDERGFASHEHNTQKIIDAMSKQTELLLARMVTQTNTSINDQLQELGEGVVIVPEDANDDNEVECLMNEMSAEEIEETNKNVGVTHLEVIRMRLKRKRARDNQNKRKYTVGYHHGKFSILPENYDFPAFTQPQLISNWFIGSNKIPPLWSLTKTDVDHIKYGPSTLSHMKSYMTIVEKYGRKKGTWIDDRTQWDSIKVNTLWSSIKMEFKRDFYPKSKRKKEISFKTVYNYMSEKNVFGNKKNKASKQNTTTTNNNNNNNNNNNIVSSNTDPPSSNIHQNTTAPTTSQVVTTSRSTNKRPSAGITTTIADTRAAKRQRTQPRSFVTTRKKSKKKKRSSIVRSFETEDSDSSDSNIENDRRIKNKKDSNNQSKKSNADTELPFTLSSDDEDDLYS